MHPLNWVFYLSINWNFSQQSTDRFFFLLPEFLPFAALSICLRLAGTSGCCMAPSLDIYLWTALNVSIHWSLNRTFAKFDLEFHNHEDSAWKLQLALSHLGRGILQDCKPSNFAKVWFFCSNIYLWTVLNVSIHTLLLIPEPRTSLQI